MREFIISELEKAIPFFKIRHQDAIIHCPFHTDNNNPNLYINLEEKTRRQKVVPAGIWRCWKCKEAGGWNKLASKLGMKTIAQDSEIDPFLKLKGEIPQPESEPNYTAPPLLEPWTGKWRRLNESFLLKIGAKKWYDAHSHAYRLWLPVTHKDQLIGHIGCALEKDVQPKYKNSSELPTGRILYALDLIKGCSQAAIITEGPYDALRLIQAGLPAVAILGVANWDASKVALLASNGFKHIIIATDADEAGYECAKQIWKDSRQSLDVQFMEFPPGDDPGSTPKKYLRILKGWVGNIK